MNVESPFNVSSDQGAAGGDVSADTHEFWDPSGGELFVHSHFYEPTGDEQPMWGDAPSPEAIEIVARLANLDHARAVGEAEQAVEAVLEGLKSITRSGDIGSDESTRIVVQAD